MQLNKILSYYMIFVIELLVFPAIVLSSSKVLVFTSIPPQKYFVEKIGGNFVDISVMIDSGANPHNYEPKPKQMADLSKAKIYFSIGINFEEVWLPRFQSLNPKLKIVYTDDGIEKFKLNDNHEGFDPHIWLSPPLVMLQARNILSALIEENPENKTIYEINYKNFIIELLDIDSEIRGIFIGKNKTEFMTFHPAWIYFAKAYGLIEISVEMEGKEPKPNELIKLIKHAKAHNIKIIFVQPQFSAKSAKTISDSIGGQIVFIDPLSSNWYENMKNAASKFKEALK
ncbi:MAG: zinc ABC transporter substrate-binding protein [Desulfobacterales bacterium]|nr:zinc ABC transporter substrate-binding protein [Desulfobacterales bacterium]